MSYTQVDLALNCVPRLFHNEAAAKRALTWWLKGKCHAYRDSDDGYSFYNIGPDQPIHDPSRNRRVIDVVPVELTFPLDK